MEKYSVGVGTCGSKIILIGEHSVVYGEPAIAMPVPAVRVVARTTYCRGPVRLNCAFYNGFLDDGGGDIDGLKTVIPATLRHLQRPETDLMISIRSAIPAERGMGSSASVAIAVVRSLFNYFNVPLDQETLLTLVGLSEACCHGQPSGLDAAAASSSHPIYFMKKNGTEFIRHELRSCLVIADSGLKGQTKKAVAALRQHLAQEPALRGKIDRLGALTVAARKALETAGADVLGRILTDAHEILRDIGVSHPVLDRLVNTAMAAGALGAKMTGGGCGGCIIALVPFEEQAQHLADRLKHAGAFQTWVQPFESRAFDLSVNPVL